MSHRSNGKPLLGGANGVGRQDQMLHKPVFWIKSHYTTANNQQQENGNRYVWWEGDGVLPILCFFGVFEGFLKVGCGYGWCRMSEEGNLKHKRQKLGTPSTSTLSYLIISQSNP